MRITEIFYYIVHYQQLRAIIQWKVWHRAVHERDKENEPVALRICFDLLEKTSRSLVAVIQELHPELLLPIALFYLILRGLDTVGDDMTIPLEDKDPLLRDFYHYIEVDGWSYNSNGPEVRDRHLLANFASVKEEFRKIKPVYREIIKDITRKMGNGMADHAHNAEHNVNGVNTIKDYDLYCHYVAGLVGHGLTQLFVESKLANPALLDRPHLQESMGLFLQKTKIIRDIREDFQDKRRFWPKEIWSKHVNDFADLFKPENLNAALNCNAEMVLNSLPHAKECLFYLAGLKEQSVFNFAAIPQAMAIATLDLVFRNPAIFRQNIQMTRGQACRIMVDSTQYLQLVCNVFRAHLRNIHRKNNPRDPNFLKISITCGELEQFIESIFPSQQPSALAGGLAPDEEPMRRAMGARQNTEDSFYMLPVVVVTLFTLSFVMVGIAYFLGPGFDVGVSDIIRGSIHIASRSGTQHIAHKLDHPEL